MPVCLPPPSLSSRGIVAMREAPYVSFQISPAPEGIVIVDTIGPLVKPRTLELRSRKPGEAGGRLLKMGTSVAWPTDADSDY
jgi:hypothetical protein